MFYDYLNDIEFLQELDKQHLKTTYAKIVLLSFKDETSYGEIQGRITSGSISVNGSSAVRRTINLSMLADKRNATIENIENEISLKKKVSVFVGVDNPIKAYTKYSEIIWFPMGMFILTSANIQRSTSGWSISIGGKDKMCLLDGTCGGSFPATTNLDEGLVEEDDGSITVKKVPIWQIIFEAVNHWGGEGAERIIISDVDREAKQLMKYVGENPIYFSKNYESLHFNASTTFPHTIVQNQDAGYTMTSFTWPGELTVKAGDTVVTLLDKVKNLLGNYEYFYDVYGNFIFQKIKNYLDTGSPLNELQESNYTKSYNNAKFLYDLTQLDTTTSITVSPKYDNVKNDFYVQGQRDKADICYHLVIDNKPMEVDSTRGVFYAKSYMWQISDDKTGLIVRYDLTQGNEAPATASGQTVTLVGKALGDSEYEWREELYRRALDAQVTNSVNDNYYDSELLKNWRSLYDTLNANWDATGHWNPDVTKAPEKLTYWLDFIDTGSALGAYSVKEIGRRTKVVNDTSIKTIYNKEVPDLVFIEGYDTSAIAKYAGIGQRYFVLTSGYFKLFAPSSTGASCFDKIRELMYQNLSYNTTISLTCLPKYYIEPNNIIHVEDKDSGINGNYQITQFTLPLTYNGTMNITATEVLTRV